MALPKLGAEDRTQSRTLPAAPVETRPAIERGNYGSVIKSIQTRFPKILARLGR